MVYNFSIYGKFAFTYDKGFFYFTAEALQHQNRHDSDESQDKRVFDQALALPRLQPAIHFSESSLHLVHLLHLAFFRIAQRSNRLTFVLECNCSLRATFTQSTFPYPQSASPCIHNPLSIKSLTAATNKSYPWKRQGHFCT